MAYTFNKLSIEQVANNLEAIREKLILSGEREFGAVMLMISCGIVPIWELSQSGESIATVIATNCNKTCYVKPISGELSGPWLQDFADVIISDQRHKPVEQIIMDVSNSNLNRLKPSGFTVSAVASFKYPAKQPA